MNTLLRYLFFHIIVRLVTRVILGLNVRHGERLPSRGPAVIIANHNSHLDTMVIMTLMLKHLSVVKPVAAMDYFLSNPFLSWFSLKIIGILPLNRKKKTPDEDVLIPLYKALEEDNILILFPEGSRGKPEKFQKLKSGIARISEKFPDLPVVPIFFYGLGKSLPKGEALLVPFYCDVFVGETIRWSGDRTSFMENLNASFTLLSDEAEVTGWE